MPPMPALLLGGPLDGQVAPAPPDTRAYKVGDGEYVRGMILLYSGPEPSPEPQRDRWAKKVRPNPFPKPRG